MYARTDGETDGRTDGRRTDFDTKLIYPFFLKKKAGIISTKLLCLYLVQHLLHQIKAQQFYSDLDLYQQC